MPSGREERKRETNTNLANPHESFLFVRFVFAPFDNLRHNLQNLREIIDSGRDPEAAPAFIR